MYMYVMKKYHNIQKNNHIHNSLLKYYAYQKSCTCLLDIQFQQMTFLDRSPIHKLSINFKENETSSLFYRNGQIRIPPQKVAMQMTIYPPSSLQKLTQIPKRQNTYQNKPIDIQAQSKSFLTKSVPCSIFPPFISFFFQLFMSLPLASTIKLRNSAPINPKFI